VLRKAQVTLNEILSYQLPGGTEQKYENLSRELVSGNKIWLW
jgi:hypothetical protein